MFPESWLDWRRHVVALIRLDFREVLQDIGEDDIDWDAWRPLYEAGRSPKAAVDCAFLRDPFVNGGYGVQSRTARFPISVPRT